MGIGNGNLIQMLVQRAVADMAVRNGQVPSGVQSQQNAQMGQLNSNPEIPRYEPTSGTPQSAFSPQTSMPYRPYGGFSSFGGKGGGYSPFGGKGGYSPFGGFGGYSSYDPYTNPYSRAFEQNLMPTYQSNPYAQQPPMLTQPVENPQFRSLPYTPGGMQPVSQVLPAEPIFESGMKPGGRPLVGDRMPIRQPIGGKGFFKQGGEVK